MFFDALVGSNMYAFVIIPILIFLARILDVSIGTIRLIFISRGFKFLAPVLGFFEVLIWLAAIQQILVNLTNVVCYIAYAGGFATGTFVGLIIEEKLSVGKVIVRVITKRKSSRIVRELKDAGYTVTSIAGEGPAGKVKILFMIVKRQKVVKIVELIKKINPKAFYSIEDVRYAKEDTLPAPLFTRKYPNFFGFLRKAK